MATSIIKETIGDMVMKRNTMWWSQQRKKKEWYLALGKCRSLGVRKKLHYTRKPKSNKTRQPVHRQNWKCKKRYTTTWRQEKYKRIYIGWPKGDKWLEMILTGWSVSRIINLSIHVQDKVIKDRSHRWKKQFNKIYDWCQGGDTKHLHKTSGRE